METIVIDIKSEKDKELFLALVKRLRLKARVISDEDKMDFGLFKAMLQGKTDEFINVENYLKKLRKK